MNWLTSGERSAARAALKQIDALQDAGPLSYQEFEARDEQAKAKVKAAELAAKTQRDNSIQDRLFWYLAGVELERIRIDDKNRTDQLVQQGRIPKRTRDEESDKTIDTLLSDLKRDNRVAIQKALD